MASWHVIRFYTFSIIPRDTVHNGGAQNRIHRGAKDLAVKLSPNPFTFNIFIIAGARARGRRI